MKSKATESSKGMSWTWASRFVLAGDDDRVTVLDPEATWEVLAVAQKSNNAKDIKLRVKHALQN